MEQTTEIHRERSYASGRTKPAACDASQDGRQTEAIRQAAREIDRIDSYETVLADYVTSVAAQDDTTERIRSLLNLTNYYHREFGVHFEKRHAYRDQLLRVVSGEVSTLDAARREARQRYEQLLAPGLPHVMGMVGRKTTSN